jgi:hypothetical protein
MSRIGPTNERIMHGGMQLATTGPMAELAHRPAARPRMNTMSPLAIPLAMPAMRRHWRAPKSASILFPLNAWMESEDHGRGSGFSLFHAAIASRQRVRRAS